MTAKVLRLFQESCITRARDSIRRGNRRILIVLPTGGGKSVIFSKIILGADNKENDTLFMVHRRELIKQAAQHLQNEGVYPGIIMSGEPPSLMARTQLASVQTLWSRCETYKRIPWPMAHLVVIDEAHHCSSKTYDNILEHYPDEIIIGVTATPIRANGKGLGHTFDDMIIGATVRELMDLGYLCEASYMVPNIPDLKDVSTARGDYVEDQLADVMNDAKLIGNIVTHYKQHAEHRKGIAFAVNVAHSRALCDQFNYQGIPAAHIDGKTPLKEREQIIADYVAGKYQVLCNCEVFTEGYDMPALDAVVVARPTKSLAMHLQMCGRGLRPKEGGGDLLILDHAGNVLRHGPVDEEHDWALDERVIQERDYEKNEDNEEREVKEYRCESCGNIFSKQAICPKCGTPLPHYAKDIETARGELVDLPWKPKKKKKQVTVEEKKRWYGMFLAYAKDKNYKPGWAFHKYKDKFGVAPHGDDYIPFEAARYPLEFTNYLKHLRIKYIKQQEKIAS